MKALRKKYRRRYGSSWHKNPRVKNQYLSEKKDDERQLRRENELTDYLLQMFRSMGADDATALKLLQERKKYRSALIHATRTEVLRECSRETKRLRHALLAAIREVDSPSPSLKRAYHSADSLDVLLTGMTQGQALRAHRAYRKSIK